jgi:hypothetical protein
MANCGFLLTAVGLGLYKHSKKEEKSLVEMMASLRIVMLSGGESFKQR